MTIHTMNDAQKVSMAKRLAKEHNMFIVTKPTYYLLYSISTSYRPEGAKPKNNLVGTRSSAQGIYILVRKCCNK